MEKEIFRSWMMIVATARGNERKEHALADAMNLMSVSSTANDGSLNIIIKLLV